ncbi:DUF2552 family protein [Bacillus carboniphilus]|uniref:DUF2552 family protein n=1 Tax=Bacillus carboniphilus TaxID=86663 RepID=A0ABY9JY02_9BACI|nr:DUF2552 family protein [Bacillus carboniphilus]WLR44274.1 DUF2552 family protein [Bacillus carboniphilus]
MEKKLKSLRNIALNKTWVSFTNENHPYSLLHWSIGGVEVNKKDVWLLQDEMTFETQEFETIDQALSFIEVHLKEITEVLG